MRLALDHLTAVDATPAILAQSARDAGCDAICLFMEPMAVLPLMPQFDLYRDRRARADLRRQMDDLGLTLDLAYPFTLAGRSEIADFAAPLACAAELGAQSVNVLCYDRSADRRIDRFGEFCDAARSFGLGVALEFFPASQIRSLAEGLDLAGAIDRPGAVGVNVDLLHLMRSGGSIAELAAAPAGLILYGQFCDGPIATDAPDPGIEASAQRLLPGEGCFDIAGFARALPAHCPASIEIPRDDAVLAGEPREDRIRRAVEGLRRLL